jgi:hypothetical protein
MDEKNRDSLARAEQLRGLASVCQNLATGILLLGVIAPIFKLSSSLIDVGYLPGSLAATIAATVLMVISQRLLEDAARVGP